MAKTSHPGGRTVYRATNGRFVPESYAKAHKTTTKLQHLRIDECTLYRSSETGRFVPKAYVESHPATTETEHWPIPHRGERTLYRSAGSGRFVPKADAKSHPAMMEIEHRRR